MPEDYQNLDEDNDEEQNNVSPSPSPSPSQPLSRGQKLAAAALAVFAILAIFMWAAQFKQSISGSLNKKAATNNTPAANVQANSEEALKSKDTDGDGLSDWDELNIYHTSPYLADSDSDGIPDGVEVKNGTDPNCPEGRNCSGGNLSPAVSATSTPAPSFNLNVNQNDKSTSTLEKVFQGASDAASLRKLLLDSGMDKKVLDQISDADLIKSYNQTLNNPPAQ